MTNNLVMKRRGRSHVEDLEEEAIPERPFDRITYPPVENVASSWMNSWFPTRHASITISTPRFISVLFQGITRHM